MRLQLPSRAGRKGLRRWIAPVIASTVLLSGGAVAAKATTGVSATAVASALGVRTAAHNTTVHGTGRGPNEFGMTLGNIRGDGTRFTYTHGFFCDPRVAAQSATRCEVGAPATQLPPGAHLTDTLFIAVPLGFNANRLHCPNQLTCVDHPMTVDMTRIAAALAPVFKTTPAALTPQLRNFPTPGHTHFIANKHNGQAIWWNVKVIGVTSPVVYQQIQKRQSLAFIQQLLAQKNANVVGPIPTNIFLFFAASGT